MQTNAKFVERLALQIGDGCQAKTRRIFLPLGYSSLLGRCLRLVSYATGALPHLRLRAFRRRSSLPSLCYRIAGNSVAAF